MVEDLSESTVESSTLVEIQRLQVLQEPEQRSYNFIMDGDVKGYYITYGKLDCQLWAIGALLQQYTVRRERVLLPGAVRLK